MELPLIEENGKHYFTGRGMNLDFFPTRNFSCFLPYTRFT